VDNLLRCTLIGAVAQKLASVLKTLTPTLAALLLAAASPAPAQEPVLTLEAAVAQALDHNLVLRAQKLEPEIARQGVIIEDSAFDVVLSGDAGTHRSSQEFVGAETQASQYEQDNVTVGASKRVSTGATATLETSLTRTESNAAVVRAGEQFDTALTLRLVQPLLQGAWSGANLARLRQAESRLAEEQLRLRGRAMDLTLEVTRRYWTLSHAYARRDLLLSALEAAQALVDEMQARADRGLATPIDLLQAQAQLASRKEDLILAETAIADAGDALAEAMGNLLRDPGTGFTPEVADLPLTEVQMGDFQKIWVQVLIEDLDTRIQELAIERSDLQRLIELNARRARLDAYAEGSLQGNDEGRAGRAYRNALSHDGHAWSAGVQFSVPWGQREGIARVRQAELLIEQAKTRLIELKQDLYKRARAAWRNVDAGNERLRAARTRVEFEENAYAQARARYDRGLSSFRELLEARRDLDTARLVLVDVLRDLAIARSSVARLDGSLFQQLGNPLPPQE